MEGDNEGVWVDGEEEPPDNFRYNGKGRKNRCMNREHVEDSFEANNHNISKVRSESRNKIVQSKQKSKPIDLSWTAHLHVRLVSSNQCSELQMGGPT